MSDIYDSGPAFPVDRRDRYGEITDNHLGISVRDYFAAKAMQGLLANSESVHSGAEPIEAAMFGHNGAGVIEACATMSYRMADAMIKARSA